MNQKALGDLFKPNRERERDQQRARRKAFREAQNAVDVVKDRVGKFKKERDKLWTEARKYLADGQRAAAQRSLQACRATEMMAAKLDMKRWVFEQLLTKLELAKTDQEFAGAMSAINTVVKIDPEAVANVLDEVEDKLGDQVDTDKFWENVHGKEMDGVQNQMTDIVPTVEDMMKDLKEEVAEDIGVERPARSRLGSTESERASSRDREGSLDQQISEGKRRVQGGLGGDK